ncbi:MULTISPECIES: phage repressor protein CI [unclassified Serratia (in: enterobacteria)]|uniref:phage repressor protein CI n=1 Tax=unclassified Serratia (in: enterobacteria) TaxID=2647522 RepID=UPI0030767F42
MKFDGGKAVIQRILQAYGFSTQKQLHDHLGVGNGTVSTWIKRDYFPGDVVIQCALETGRSLEWLALGTKTVEFDNKLAHAEMSKEFDNFERWSLNDGTFQVLKNLVVEKDMFPLLPRNPLYIQSSNIAWLTERDFNSITDGRWVLIKEEVAIVEKVKALPDKNWLIEDVVWPSRSIDFIAKFLVTIDIG